MGLVKNKALDSLSIADGHALRAVSRVGFSNDKKKPEAAASHANAPWLCSNSGNQNSFSSSRRSFGNWKPGIGRKFSDGDRVTRLVSPIVKGGLVPSKPNFDSP